VTLSKQAIADFQKIYLLEFGVELSNQDASEKAIKLLRLFKLIYQPVPKEWLRENIQLKK